MGAKVEKEMVILLKAISIYNKLTLQEIQILRKCFEKHSKRQLSALKEWMKKDLDHHFKDNKLSMLAIEKMNGGEKNGEKEKKKEALK